MLFVAIGTVGDAFFAPAVERIATRLRLPDDVAGATLLALGGAAPDIFTQIAALVESAEPDLRLALSESIGAGLFVAAFGKALAVLVGLAWEAKRRVGDNDDGSITVRRKRPSLAAGRRRGAVSVPSRRVRVP